MKRRTQAVFTAATIVLALLLAASAALNVFQILSQKRLEAEYYAQAATDNSSQDDILSRINFREYCVFSFGSDEAEKFRGNIEVWDMDGNKVIDVYFPASSSSNWEMAEDKSYITGPGFIAVYLPKPFQPSKIIAGGIEFPPIGFQLSAPWHYKFSVDGNIETNNPDKGGN